MSAGRIRTIKPELLDDEKASSLSDTAWRLYLSAWCLCDDYGRLRCSTRYIHSHVFAGDASPATAHKTALAIDELEARGFIKRYENAGEMYAEIKNWSKHQRIHKPSVRNLMPALKDPGSTPASAPASRPGSSPSLEHTDSRIPPPPSSDSGVWKLPTVAHQAMAKEADFCVPKTPGGFPETPERIWEGKGKGIGSGKGDPAENLENELFRYPHHDHTQAPDSHISTPVRAPVTVCALAAACASVCASVIADGRQSFRAAKPSPDAPPPHDPSEHHLLDATAGAVTSGQKGEEGRAEQSEQGEEPSEAATMAASAGQEAPCPPKAPSAHEGSVGASTGGSRPTTAFQLDAPKPPKVGKRGRLARSFLTADWRPSEQSVIWAHERGIDAAAHVDEFVTYWVGEGESKADWDATFRNRLLGLQGYGRAIVWRKPLAPLPPAPPAEPFEPASPEQMAELAQMLDAMIEARARAEKTPPEEVTDSDAWDLLARKERALALAATWDEDAVRAGG